ncbi:putative Transposon Ty3-G Gag-Pol polyprotein [Paratrimastix pyriformis]|uniref:Transposon Ty3-G Gag-Pol polyprotein n=1 Tax=Paratrimastix pyriformis TaxID=342808 RepID=A0ABQ8U9S7_9EUKA|nr:putative Transposon Ty3-G Gag-Pol polyprotein [Paratrimastix pyriformis]
MKSLHGCRGCKGWSSECCATPAEGLEPLCPRDRATFSSRHAPFLGKTTVTLLVMDSKKNASASGMRFTRTRVKRSEPSDVPSAQKLNTFIHRYTSLGDALDIPYRALRERFPKALTGDFGRAFARELRVLSLPADHHRSHEDLQAVVEAAVARALSSKFTLDPPLVPTSTAAGDTSAQKPPPEGTPTQEDAASDSSAQSAETDLQDLERARLEAVFARAVDLARRLHEARETLATSGLSAPLPSATPASVPSDYRRRYQPFPPHQGPSNPVAQQGQRVFFPPLAKLEPEEKERLRSLGICVRCRGMHPEGQCPRAINDPPSRFNRPPGPAPAPAVPSTSGLRPQPSHPPPRRSPRIAAQAAARDAARHPLRRVLIADAITMPAAPFPPCGVVDGDFCTTAVLPDGRGVPALLDSGARTSVIDSRLVSSLGLVPTPGGPHILAADGFEIPSKGLVRLPLRFTPDAPTPTTITAQVVDGLHQPEIMIISQKDLTGYVVSSNPPAVQHLLFDIGTDGTPDIEEPGPPAPDPTALAAAAAATVAPPAFMPSHASASATSTTSAQPTTPAQNPAPDRPPPDWAPPCRVAEGVLLPDERGQLVALIYRHRNAFGGVDSMPAILEPFHVDLVPGSRPVSCPPRRMRPADLDFVKAELGKLLLLGIIRPSTSAWACPLTVARKRDGSRRLCVDLTALNSVTIQPPAVLPAIDDLLHRFQGQRYVAKFDCSAGFHQIQVDPLSVPLLAFTSPLGRFEFTRMPFGARTAPLHFQHQMDLLLQSLGSWSWAYQDDIAVVAPVFTLFLTRLDAFFTLVEARHLRLKAEKCLFAAPETPYLGFIVSATGCRVDPDRLAPLLALGAPTSRAELMSYLGAVNYLSKFVPRCAQLTAGLFDLLHKGASFKWGPEHQSAFQQIQALLATAPLLAHPDSQCHLLLRTDASSTGLGAVLLQVRPDGREEKAKPMLYGPVDVVVDHRNLTFPSHADSPRLVRWRGSRSFDVTLRYLPGASNVLADTLSRLCGLRLPDDPSPCSHIPSPCTRAAINTGSRDPLPRSSAFIRSTTHSLSSRARGSTSCCRDHALYEASPAPAPACLYPCLRPAPPAVPPSAGPTAESPAPAGDPRLVQPRLLLRPPLVTPLTLPTLTLIQSRSSAYGGPFSRLPHLIPRPGRAHTQSPPAEQKAQLLALAHSSLLSAHAGVTHNGPPCHLHQLAPHDGRCQCFRPCLPDLPEEERQVPTPSTLLAVTSSGPFELLEADHIGPCPRPRLSSCSRPGRPLVPLYPLGPAVTTTAEETARLILTSWISVHGPPTRLITDGGPAFDSDVIRELCRTLGVDLHISTPHSPQSHGSVERANRVIGDALRAFFRDSDVDPFLPAVQYS